MLAAKVSEYDQEIPQSQSLIAYCNDNFSLSEYTDESYASTYIKDSTRRSSKKPF